MDLIINASTAPTSETNNVSTSPSQRPLPIFATPEKKACRHKPLEIAVSSPEVVCASRLQLRNVLQRLLTRRSRLPAVSTLKSSCLWRDSLLYDCTQIQLLLQNLLGDLPPVAEACTRPSDPLVTDRPIGKRVKVFCPGLEDLGTG